MSEQPPSLSPRFAALPPPLLVVGMHRSGTSLIAGMLTALGVCLDPAMPPPPEGAPFDPPSDKLRSDGYCEAEAFRLLDERILDSAGAAWHEIAPFLAVRDDPRFMERSVRTMLRATHGALASGFLDLAPHPLHAWGWKDPRTSLLLPYWLQLFPDARILHVRRDPARVVDSLLKRAGSEDARSPVILPRIARAVHSPAAVIRAVRRRIAPSPAEAGHAGMDDRQRYRELCDAYVAACERYRDLAPERYLEIAFEEAVANPADVAKQLAAFARLDASPGRLQSAANFVRP
jgi:hypothetical protein